MQRHAREKSMPHVFSLQLAWESQTEPADAIVGTLDAMVAEEVDLGAAHGNKLTCSPSSCPCQGGCRPPGHDAVLGIRSLFQHRLRVRG